MGGYRCGADNFNLFFDLKTTNAFCSMMDYLEKSSNQKYSQRNRDMRQRLRNKRREPRRFNKVSENED